jgi:hypothetical protein
VKRPLTEEFAPERHLETWTCPADRTCVVDPAGGTDPPGARRREPGRRAVLISAFCFLICSCGYHVAGQGARVPPDVKTIAVPAFENQSSRYRIEQWLSAAVTREFLERTKFRIVSDPAGADAVLKGTVKDVRAGVVTFDLQTGRAATLQIEVTAAVALLDLHTHKTIFANNNYIFREEYQVSQTTSELFEEDQPALKRLSRDLARTLVTEILENF